MTVTSNVLFDIHPENVSPKCTACRAYGENGLWGSVKIHIVHSKGFHDHARGYIFHSGLGAFHLSKVIATGLSCLPYKTSIFMEGSILSSRREYSFRKCWEDMFKVLSLSRSESPREAHNNMSDAIMVLLYRLSSEWRISKLYLFSAPLSRSDVYRTLQ